MDEEILDVETFACFSCMRPNEYYRKICKFCNAPISQTSSSDPLQMAYGEGMAYRKAAEGKPKLLVVVGVWIIFFPTFIIAAFSVLDTVMYGAGTMGLVLFWVMLVVGGFCSVMLYRVTRNYFAMEEFDHGKTVEDVENL